MKISSDVNIIFAYADTSHLFHKEVLFFMIRSIRDRHVLLSEVKTHFLYTYKDYLATGCIIVEKAISEYRKTLRKSPSTTYKPSFSSMGINVDALIKKYIEENLEDQEFDPISVKRFISMMLSEYPIPTLVMEDKALGNFREKYSINAEERANEILNKFIHFFKPAGFELMKIEQYTGYAGWLDKIKTSKNADIFKNKQDREDIEVAAEFLSYTTQFGILNFFTCDRNCYQSIKKVAKEYNLSTGTIYLIEKKKN